MKFDDLLADFWYDGKLQSVLPPCCSAMCWPLIPCCLNNFVIVSFLFLNHFILINFCKVKIKQVQRGRHNYASFLFVILRIENMVIMCCPDFVVKDIMAFCSFEFEATWNGLLFILSQIAAVGRKLHRKSYLILLKLHRRAQS